MGNGQAKTDWSSLILHLLGEEEPRARGHGWCYGLGSLRQLLTLARLGTLGQGSLSLQPLWGWGEDVAVGWLWGDRSAVQCCHSPAGAPGPGHLT